MRELALHILDLVENSLRAEASVIEVALDVRAAEDRLRITVQDNGTGLRVPPEAVLNPFYTTKPGKRTGLGLSLFRAAAEAAGGRLELGRSELGAPAGVTGSRPGVRVCVEMGLNHIDRTPLGDLAGTLGTVVCTHPEVDLRFALCCGGAAVRVSSAAVAERDRIRGQGLLLARRVISQIQAALATCPGLR